MVPKQLCESLYRANIALVWLNCRFCADSQKWAGDGDEGEGGEEGSAGGGRWCACTCCGGRGDRCAAGERRAARFRPVCAGRMAEHEEVDLTGDNSPEPPLRKVRRSSGAQKRPRTSGSVDVQLDDGSTAKVREASSRALWQGGPAVCHSPVLCGVVWRLSLAPLVVA